MSAAITLLKLFEGVMVMEVISALLILAGFLTASLGVRRFMRIRTLIEAADKD